MRKAERNAMKAKGRIGYIGLRLPSAMYMRIREIAEGNMRTVSGEIRFAVAERIERETAKAGTATA